MNDSEFDQFRFVPQPKKAIDDSRASLDFHNNQARKNPNYDMITIRGLKAREFNRGDEKIRVDGYADALPTLEGRNIIQIVNEEIAKRKREAQVTGNPFKPVRLADLGYGVGRFLLDAREEWGNDVELIGVGPDVYTKVGGRNSSALDGQGDAPTYEALMQAHIQLIDQNIIDINDALKGISIDVLVSSNALSYVNYPTWELIKKMYRALGDGGVALLDSCCVYSEGNTEIQDTQPLQEYLKGQGYNFEFDGENYKTAFKKTKPDLNVPVRTLAEPVFGGISNEVRIVNLHMTPLSSRV